MKLLSILRKPEPVVEEKPKPSPGILRNLYQRSSLMGGDILGYGERAPLDYAKILTHQPSQSIYPIDHQDMAFPNITYGEAAMKRRKAMSFPKPKLNEIPYLFSNPMQQFDYQLYETLLRHTFIGYLSDALIDYVVGTGWKPELEIINPDKDNEKNTKLIEKHQQVITDLLEIDRQVEAHVPGNLDIPFADKVTAMITSCLLYNRGALIFNHDGDREIEIRGTKYPDIPNQLIFAHAQDLGMIDIDPKNRMLRAVEWRHAQDRFVGIDDMVYLWNPPTSNKVYNSQFYGMSILSPLMPAAKIIRQLLTDDFPAMARNAWAGLFLLVVKDDGNTPESKEAEYASLTAQWTPGTPALLIKDPEDVNSFDVKFDAKVSEFKDLYESMVKSCISSVGLPQVGFFDESAANRATMVGKIQLTMRTTIEPKRRWIGRAIADQWYMRWFRLLYPELQDKFRIKMSFEDLHVAEWYDQFEAALKLDGRGKLKDTEFGELIGLDNYPQMLDPDAEIMPGGQQSQPGGGPPGAGGGPEGALGNTGGPGSKLQMQKNRGNLSMGGNEKLINNNDS